MKGKKKLEWIKSLSQKLVNTNFLVNFWLRNCGEQFFYLWGLANCISLFKLVLSMSFLAIKASINKINKNKKNYLEKNEQNLGLLNLKPKQYLKPLVELHE
ncbi:hypothetical protein BpHYR1_024480 [Brachionus plicatilis]|uniref:Transmembrane protein n=1 Tax=Brachionus plicatilis TaxID=10195 RepID=A0A3M7SDN8_BRAPC|nr:hypothetical protein BpHYR1_024480 [Brachionus plicatilis]